jgi:hypothetical protein
MPMSSAKLLDVFVFVAPRIETSNRVGLGRHHSLLEKGYTLNYSLRSRGNQNVDDRESRLACRDSIVSDSVL